MSFLAFAFRLAFAFAFAFHTPFRIPVRGMRVRADLHTAVVVLAFALDPVRADNALLFHPLHELVPLRCIMTKDVRAHARTEAEMRIAWNLVPFWPTHFHVHLVQVFVILFELAFLIVCLGWIFRRRTAENIVWNVSALFLCFERSHIGFQLPRRFPVRRSQILFVLVQEITIDEILLISQILHVVDRFNWSLLRLVITLFTGFAL